MRQSHILTQVISSVQGLIRIVGELPRVNKCVLSRMASNVAIRSTQGHQESGYVTAPIDDTLRFKFEAPTVDTNANNGEARLHFRSHAVDVRS